jgi:glycosidase
MVGEANGVAADELGEWVGTNGVYDLLVEFNHTHIPMGESEIWSKPAQWKLTDLKRVLTASQKATATNGWYPAFFENHDQPRSTVNFFRCEGSTAAKAKALGTVLLMRRGTPFLYQGEELGYSNRVWGSIDEFDDLQTRSQYEFALTEGFTPEQAQQKFGFLMNAFKYGAPPHGGLAYGLDRFVSLFAELDSIRDCIAFPKNNSGRDVMLDAPGPIDQQQLDELRITVKGI